MKSTYSHDAGSLALNFLNTVEERTGYLKGSPPSSESELLKSYDHLLEWCESMQIITGKASTELANSHSQKERESALKSALLLRESLFRLVLARIQRVTPDQSDLLKFNKFLKAQPTNQLSVKRGEWTLAPECREDDLLFMVSGIVDDAARIITSADPERLRVCAMPECGWLFLDTSKNGRRRWCDMNDCGNRAKAKRFYERYQ